MLKDFTTKLATLALTLAVSTTMVAAAVGPATVGGQHAVASAPRFMA